METVTPPNPEARAERVSRFFVSNGSSYDWAVLLMSLGADRYWKRRLLARVPADSGEILDLACGTGIVTCKLARRNPAVRIVGVDLTEDFLQVAREKAARLKLNAEFLHANAETVPLAPESFDCVVSSYIPKYVDAGRLLDNVGPALRPGGTIVLHDFTLPKRRPPQLACLCYLRLANVLWLPFFPGWKAALRELPELIVSTRWVEDFEAALRLRGFVDLRTEYLTQGSAAILSAKKSSLAHL